MKVKARSCYIFTAVLALLAQPILAVTITWNDKGIVGGDRYNNGIEWPNVDDPDSWPSRLHGQINISGATLFKSFFAAPAQANEWGIFMCERGTCPSPCNCPAPFTCAAGWCDTTFGCCYRDVDENVLCRKHGDTLQKLGTKWTGSPINTVWLINYRGVGSVNGLKELLDYQANPLVAPGFLPAPSDGIINEVTYSTSANPQQSPQAQEDISLAVMDVPVSWTVQAGAAQDAAPSRKPAQSGYGQNPNVSSTGFGYGLELMERDISSPPDGVPDVFFNTNEANPDEWTLFSTEVAWVAIGFVSNRGVGQDCFSVRELDCLFLTGRRPNGENLVANTRTPFSGTRNGGMNSIGLDPSWGMGDNIGNEKVGGQYFQIGYHATNNPLPGGTGNRTQPTNAEGSSDLETAVTNWRLGVGYNGLLGSGRAGEDSCVGQYEILSVKFDDRGGSVCVRPSVNSILHNSLADNGWQVGGPETFVSHGDPYVRDPSSVAYMDNQAAAEYLLNMMASIKDFVSVPSDPKNFGSPGEYMASQFTLLGAVDQIPAPNDPTNFVTNPDFNLNLQNDAATRTSTGCQPGGPGNPYIFADYGIDPLTGSPRAGLCPVRRSPASGDAYTDGSTNGRYCDCGGQTILGPDKLGMANAVQGDFNCDGYRDINDAELLVRAWYQPRTFAQSDLGGCGALWTSYPDARGCSMVIPEVIGDFNGDGDFDKEDLRYFMDGLAIYPDRTGQLNRKQGAIAIDNSIITWVGANYLPWADPDQSTQTPPATPCSGNPTMELPNPSVASFLVTGKTYAAGDFRGDVAGSAAGPMKGAWPTGWDGIVDNRDIDYVVANFGKFFENGLANYAVDLSADMNGDLVVDINDLVEMVEVILKTEFGDVDLDGDVDNDDRDIIGTSKPITERPGLWADGDVNGDGLVNDTDWDIWNATSAPGFQSMQGMIRGWSSLATHGSAGEFAVALDPQATGSAVVSESRSAGVSKILVQFFLNMESQFTNPSAVVVKDANTGTPVASSISATVNGADLVLQFSPALPDRACYFIDVSPCFSVALSPGSFTHPTLNPDGHGGCCMVRALKGDTNNDGKTDLTDMAQVKSKVIAGASVPPDQRYDVNVDGVISLTDMALVKSIAVSGGGTISCP